MDDSLNDTHEDKLDTSRSSTSDETTHSPRTKVPFALHIDTENKENDKGESKPSTPKSGQNKNATKKPQTPTESAHHGLRAPYAQPVLDASKKSTIGERLAVAKERRIQQQKQLELEFKSRLEKGDQAYAKFIQTKEDKRRQIEEHRAKDGQHRKEVEMRKKQMEEEEKKKAAAKIARTEQVYEVKMRQKRSTSTDRAMKRWSWGAGADGDEGQKSASQTNLSSPSMMKPSGDRFTKSPLLINSPHMAFASGLRSYDYEGNSPGRPASSSGLTEPVAISSRLLAPTRASLARSRNAVNEIDDSASQSSNDSRSHGPMRSRSKDRRSPASARPHTAPRVDATKTGSGKATTDKKLTPTRGASATVPNRRPPSPAKMATPTASSEAKRTTPIRSTLNELNKPKRGTSPQPRPNRAPSPAGRSKQGDVSHTTPTRTTPKRQPSPSPVAPKTKTKTKNESPKPGSTPPSIKPSLRPASANQIKTKSSLTATAKPKNKTDGPKPIKKPAGKNQNPPEKSEKDSGYQDAPKPQEEKQGTIPTSASGPALSISTTSGALSKSASDTSQDVSDIPKLELEDVKVAETTESSQAAKIETPADQVEEKPEQPAKEAEKLPENDFPAVAKPTSEPEQPDAALQQNTDSKTDLENEAPTAPQPPVAVTQPPVPEPAQEEAVGGQNQDEPTTTAKPDLGEEEGSEEVLQDIGDVSHDIQPDSLTSFQTVEPVDPRAVSPADSLEDVQPEREEIPQSQSLRAELGFESLDVPQPDSFDEESDEELPSVKENKPEIKETAEGPEKDSEEASDELVISEDQPDGAGEQVAMETIQKDEEENMEKIMKQDVVDQVSEPAMENETTATSQMAEDRKPETASGETPVIVEEQPAPEGEVATSEISQEENTKEKEKAQNSAKEPAQNNVEATQGTERKTQPRKNLETVEEKEAYRQAIAEKRRELKEKKEQEERERQERIRLAKIEQAKREEEARRMFEEAAAAAEREKKLEEEREKMREEEERKQQEEEKRKEEEANARKREAAEKMRRDREVQKQKQEDERMARKKRLEMIMRRTRQPDAASDSAKPKNDDSASPMDTPSPQQSPASGRSPLTQSPVGGKSPLSAGTPERSISPAAAAILNKSSDSLSTLQTSEEHKEISTVVNSSTSEPNLLNFTNSTTNYDQSGVELIKIDAVEKPSMTSEEKPVPFEAFTQKNILNGVEDNSENHNGSDNMDPFGIFTNGSQTQQQMNVPVNGNQDLLNLNADVLQQKVTAEPLVPTGI